MTLSDADAGPTLTSSPSTLAVHSLVHRAETTVEHEFSSNTLITGGSFVTVEEGGVFQTHTHFTTGTEGRKGKYLAI